MKWCIIPGLLLGELFVSLLVVCVHSSNVVLSCDLICPLLALLEPLDRFNQLAPGADREDTEDMAWPGIIGKKFSCILFRPYYGFYTHIM